MTLQKFRLILLLSAFLFIQCNPQQKDSFLYQSEDFSLTANSVTQGSFEAKALSATQIVSNYQSPAAENYSRLIQFKFSINEKDNELPVGVNHWIWIQDEQESPVIQFGKAPEAKPEIADPGFLPANYPYTFYLDFSPVLEAFERDGYYTSFDGQRFAASDFKGVYIAGSSLPLSWDFVNLSNKGLGLEAVNDSGLYRIDLILNPYQVQDNATKTWELQLDLSQKPQYESPHILVDALFNLSQEEGLLAIEPDSTLRTGAKWGGVWTRDISYSILLAFAMQEPEVAMNSLRKKVNHKGIIQDTGSGGAWPISSDRTTWALAAWELYCFTGDRNWLQEAYGVIAKSLADDRLSLFSSSGLLKGESSFLDWREQSYPKWADNADIYHSENLGTNAVHYQANKIAAQMAAELGLNATTYEEEAKKIKRAINEALWLSDKSYYASYRYGRHHLYTTDKFETLGESLSILFGIADSAQAAQILANAPLTPFGASCFYPQIPGIPPYHNDAIWPFVQAYWNWAAAKTGNEKVLEHGLAALYRPTALFLSNYENMQAGNGDFQGTEINSHRMLWSIAGNLAMVYRVFIGIELTPEGILFNPSVPESYRGERSLRNFKYRDATLSIQVSGFGNQIKAFYLNDTLLTTPFFPSNLTGNHSIRIELNQEKMPHQFINRVENTFAPTIPEIYATSDSFTVESYSSGATFQVFRNGMLHASFADSIRFSTQLKGEWTVKQVNAEGWESFLSEPHLLLNETDFIQIKLGDEIPFGSEESLMKFKRSYTVIDQTNQRSLSWEYTLKESGHYWLTFRYANGTGPWNTDNNCAIRSLFVNEAYQGIFVFPQRGEKEWSDFGYTNLRPIHLKQGTNTFRLSFEEWNENMDGDINEALIEHVLLTPVL